MLVFAQAMKPLCHCLITGILSLLVFQFAPYSETVMTSASVDENVFQPQAPYYATFFYLWYQNPNTNDRWSYWNDHDNEPPRTWFSHYLPDPYPEVFHPSTELYSSTNYSIFQWQVSKIAEARIEVAIASWWEQGRKEDVALDTILNDFMGRPDNPYPNLRWAIYYEAESIGDPTVDTLVSDLTYIHDHYMESPYYLRVNDKPVIFVYSGSEDTPGTMTWRWQQANERLGNAFYINLKVFVGYANDPYQPDSWHQYAPANRSGYHGNHVFYVSPGFWREGEPERLPRNAAEFETAVQTMVAADATWKLIETWNEWGEGTAVEPGQQVQLDKLSLREVNDPDGYPFGNLYVEILSRNLPPLESGTGQ